MGGSGSKERKSDTSACIHKTITCKILQCINPCEGQIVKIVSIKGIAKKIGQNFIDQHILGKKFQVISQTSASIELKCIDEDNLTMTLGFGSGDAIDIYIKDKPGIYIASCIEIEPVIGKPAVGGKKKNPAKKKRSKKKNSKKKTSAKKTSAKKKKKKGKK